MSEFTRTQTCCKQILYQEVKFEGPIRQAVQPADVRQIKVYIITRSTYVCLASWTRG